MKSAIKLALLTGLVALSAQVIADDSAPGAMTAQQSKAMKDCMAQQKANNASMTQAAMETVYKNQIKQKDKNGNDLATGPQTPAKP
jgi:hypothetical protein